MPFSLYREPEDVNGIKVPELNVSKSHARLSYDQSNDCFTITDQGSVNGTLLNNNRLSQVRVNY